MNETPLDLKNWLLTFSSCVQNEDFERGKTLFFAECYCFGSYANAMTDLDELMERQWKMIWPNISGFNFNIEEARYQVSGSNDMACIMVPWTSTGYDKRGMSFKRPGRVTILLKKEPSSQAWLAYHTHYSLNPDGAQRNTPIPKRRVNKILPPAKHRKIFN